MDQMSSKEMQCSRSQPVGESKKAEMDTKIITFLIPSIPIRRANSQNTTEKKVTKGYAASF